MSDVSGDEMEVDSADIMTFSARNTSNKGKRSAANLPIEAEDSLPWVEKYRPDTLDDVAGHQDILATINKLTIELNRRQSIPTVHTEPLQERLIITFMPFQPLARNIKRRDNAECRVQHERKKARSLYLDVLDETPELYIPRVGPVGKGYTLTAALQDGRRAAGRATARA